jgi:hypothetical protein
MSILAEKPEALPNTTWFGARAGAVRKVIGLEICSLSGSLLGLNRLRMTSRSANISEMPIFDEPARAMSLWPRSARWPIRRARAVLRRFQAQWPGLSYDLDLSVSLVNAQAFLDGDVRRVRLFGGLVRHRKVRSAGLVVALAHETGHHLGGPPFHEYYKWLSTEDRANEWAQTVGLPAVLGSNSDRVWVRGVENMKSISS